MVISEFGATLMPRGGVQMAAPHRNASDPARLPPGGLVIHRKK